MNNNVLVMLLIGHFIADYTLQNDEMANNKKKKISHLLLHCLIYLGVSGLAMMAFGKVDLLWLALLVTISHLLIDLLKYTVNKSIQSQGHSKLIRRIKKLDDKGYIYVMDQLLHLLAIVGLMYFYTQQIEGSPIVARLYSEVPLNNQMLRYILAIVVVLKPVNITFKALFQQTKPTREMTFVKDLKVGQRIGNMERLMVLAFLSMNQYTAIGLVFTAKSVTRYKRITDDTLFAEYYLLGTLFSILATLTTYLLIFKVL